MNTAARAICIRLKILDPRVREDDGGQMQICVRRNKTFSARGNEYRRPCHAYGSKFWIPNRRTAAYAGMTELERGIYVKRETKPKA